MNDKKHQYLTSIAGILGVIALGVVLLAPTIYGGAYHQRQPGPHDWTHHHLVYSKPSGFMQTWRMQSQARYMLQYERLHSNEMGAPQAGNSWENFLQREFEFAKSRLLRRDPVVSRDWAVSFSALTGIGTVGKGMFPAKYTWDVNATPSCANDYVAMNTSLPGSSTTPNVLAFNQLYSSQNGGLPAGTCGTTGPSVTWSYESGTGVAATSIVLSFLGDKIAYIEQPGTINGSGNLVASGAAVLRVVEWHAGDGTLTSPATPSVTFTNTIAGNGANSSWTNCTAGESCMISVAFQNGDSDTRSAVYYDYPTDTIYVGDDSGVVHKFTGVFLGTPGEVTTSWPITVDAGAALASPVYDEGSGNIFVGDAAGNFSYVRDASSTVGACTGLAVVPCLGTPQRALGNTSVALLFGKVGATTPDGIVDAPIVDSTPHLDSGTEGEVYVFDGHTDDGGLYGAIFEFDTALGSELETSFGADESITTTGASSDMYGGTFDNTYFTSAGGTGFLYVCGKDNTFSDRPMLGQVVITNGVMSGTQIVHANGLDVAVAGSEECSPVTEVFNTAASTDWIFFSVGNQANQTGCTAPTSPAGASGPGCIMSLNLTTGCGGSACTNLTWPPAGVTAGIATAPGPTWSHTDATSNSGGTSAIVIDNVADVATFPQASSLYFTWIGPGSTGAPTTSCNGTTAGGCAVKLTQSGLN